MVVLASDYVTRTCKHCKKESVVSIATLKCPECKKHNALWQKEYRKWKKEQIAKAKIETPGDFVNPADVPGQITPEEIKVVDTQDVPPLQGPPGAPEPRVNEQTSILTGSESTEKAEKMMLEFSGELLEGMVKMPFDATAKATKWEAWTLSDSEAKQLADASAKLLKKYLPDWADKHPEEFLFAFTLTVIIVPRAVAYTMYTRKQKEGSNANSKGS